MERIQRSQRIESSKLKKKQSDNATYTSKIEEYISNEKEMKELLLSLIRDYNNEQRHCLQMNNSLKTAIEEESTIHKQFELMIDRIQNKQNNCKNLLISNCQILNQQISNTRDYCYKSFNLAQKLLLPFYSKLPTNANHLNSKKYCKS